MPELPYTVTTADGVYRINSETGEWEGPNPAVVAKANTNPKTNPHDVARANPVRIDPMTQATVALAEMTGGKPSHPEIKPPPEGVIV